MAWGDRSAGGDWDGPDYYERRTKEYQSPFKTAIGPTVQMKEREEMVRVRLNTKMFLRLETLLLVIQQRQYSRKNKKCREHKLQPAVMFLNRSLCQG
eukprot:2057795-Amphidinium_carterae.1